MHIKIVINEGPRRKSIIIFTARANFLASLSRLAHSGGKQSSAEWVREAPLVRRGIPASWRVTFQEKGLFSLERQERERTHSSRGRLSTGARCTHIDREGLQFYLRGRVFGRWSDGARVWSFWHGVRLRGSRSLLEAALWVRKAAMQLGSWHLVRGE